MKTVSCHHNNCSSPENIWKGISDSSWYICYIGLPCFKNWNLCLQSYIKYINKLATWIELGFCKWLKNMPCSLGTSRQPPCTGHALQSCWRADSECSSSTKVRSTIKKPQTNTQKNQNKPKNPNQPPQKAETTTTKTLYKPPQKNKQKKPTQKTPQNKT